MKNKLSDNKKYYCLKYICLLSIALYYLFFSTKINSLSEIPDEVGYIGNIAFLSGADWSGVFSSISFYGWGYSLFLYPAWIISNTGVELIRYCLYTNIFFVVTIFLLADKLLNDIVFLSKNKWSCIISLWICLSPYVASNVFKVNCEVMSIFWILLSVELMHNYFIKDSHFFSLALGFCVAYYYRIHVRMIVFVVSMSLVVFFQFIENKNKKKRVFFLIEYILAFSICWGVSTLLQSEILIYMKSLRQAETTIYNMVTSNYLLDRFVVFFDYTRIKVIIMILFSKILYLVIASGGMFFPCIITFITCTKKVKSVRRDFYYIHMYIYISAILMLLAAVFNSPGVNENYTYYFYSRYYLNIYLILECFSFAYMIKSAEWEKRWSIGMLAYSLLALVVNILLGYSSFDVLAIDTARIPDFSFILGYVKSYQELVLLSMCLSICALLFVVALENVHIKKLFIILVFAFSIRTTYSCVQSIVETNKLAYDDTELAMYLYDVDGLDDFYFLYDESYTYPQLFYRLQCLLKNIPMRVIDIERDEKEIKKIEKNKYIFKYKSSDYDIEGARKIAEGRRFSLYLME